MTAPATVAIRRHDPHSAYGPSRFVILASTPFDRQSAAALLRSHFQNAEFVELDPLQPMDANQEFAIRIAFLYSPRGPLIDMFMHDVGNGAKSPLLIVIEHTDLSLACLRNVPVMGVYAKTDSAGRFVDAVIAVLNGGTYFSEGVQLGVSNSSKASTLIALSRRERELLPLLAEGLPLREAAAKLGIGYKTADAHRTALFRKLGVRDRVGLVRFAIREGLASA